MQNGASEKIDFGDLPIIKDKKLPPKLLGPELFGKIAMEMLAASRSKKSGESRRRNPVEARFVMR